MSTKAGARNSSRPFSTHYCWFFKEQLTFIALRNGFVLTCCAEDGAANSPLAVVGSGICQLADGTSLTKVYSQDLNPFSVNILYKAQKEISTMH